MRSTSNSKLIKKLHKIKISIIAQMLNVNKYWNIQLLHLSTLSVQNVELKLVTNVNFRSTVVNHVRVIRNSFMENGLILVTYISAQNVNAKLKKTEAVPIWVAQIVTINGVGFVGFHQMNIVIFQHSSTYFAQFLMKW